ncbi:YhdH/YhfP family quinone oxidoreductase [Ectothiorhodospiraceae bacterium WFHF3C12]|nr:YhdH/YhfP family quinone oxidoreductase [Ectothiorhodospiraceae bacterium WFHF3C12]
MSDTAFKALQISETEDGNYQRNIIQRQIGDLPEGELLIRVRYSSLNYKDALSAVGNKGVTRSYPHTPGIDAAGVVEASESGDFKAGDEVIVTGFDLGMNTAGGYGQYIRIPAGWALPCPDGLDLHTAMIYGTAGFTAALSVAGLESREVAPADGPILVTGASGGVGSVAVGILARAGYDVTAVTGKADQHDFLKHLGARDVVGRDVLDDPKGKPLLKPQWAGAVDTVGGGVLVNVLKSLYYGGTATCCGLVASPKMEGATVFPFILRGVNLLGIDSVEVPLAKRPAIWQRLAGAWRVPALEERARTVSLEELDGEIDRILAGEQVGRVVVELD